MPILPARRWKKPIWRARGWIPRVFSAPTSALQSQGRQPAPRPICAAPRLRGANLIGADLYEADLREGTIAEKERSGNLRLLQHDIGAVRTARRHAELRQSGTRQDDRRHGGAGRFHRRDHERLPPDPRQSAPGQADRRRSGKCRSVGLQPDRRRSERRHPGRARGSIWPPPMAPT